MPTFRSNSSASTTMTITMTEIGRNATQVIWNVNWSVTTGSATYLGTGSNRTLYIKRASDNATLASHVIKNNAYWAKSSTYNGSFNFTETVGHPNAGTGTYYIQTSSEGTQSCIWTNRNYCTDFNVSYSMYWSNAGAPGKPVPDSFVFENSVTFTWTPATAGINNNIIGYWVVYRYGSGAFQGYTVYTNQITFSGSGLSRGTTIDCYVHAITQRGDNPASILSDKAIKNRVPNTFTGAAVNKTLCQPGESLIVTFTNTGDPDNNLYKVQVAAEGSDAILGEIVGASASKNATSISVNTNGMPYGTSKRFRVRGVDEYGIAGAWSNLTASVLFGLPIKIAPTLGAINKQVAQIKIAPVAGPINKTVIHAKIAPVVGAINKTIF